MNTIYLYRRKDNNKVVYIGITCNVKQRRKQHEKTEPFNNLRNELQGDDGKLKYHLQ